MSTQDTTPSNKRTNHKRPLVYNPAAEIIRAEHLPLVTGLSTATCWRYRRAGKFPPAIHLGENSVGFRRRDLEAWLEQRAGR
jgi:predicted DNA-binding transcriptional regulator AlpA